MSIHKLFWSVLSLLAFVLFVSAEELVEEGTKVSSTMSIKMKEKKIYPMGQKVFEKMCQQDINLTHYLEMEQLQSALEQEKLCRPLNEKRFQAVTLYLWEVKRMALLEQTEQIVQVQKDEKCPVCGMFTYKYPKWAAQIFYKEGEHQHHYSFDGVKDLMKFYFDPMAWGKYTDAKQENISKILVSDYYSQKAIDGTKAYYVLGSDILGPMGDELIPFALQSDAQTFLNDHNGKIMVTFDKITKEDVYKLDY